MVWPLMAVVFGLVWMLGKASQCPEGQIPIGYGYAAACVVGSYR